MKTILSLLLSILSFPLLAQELNYPEVRYQPDPWRGHWVTHPGISQGEAVLLHYRRTIDLAAVPEAFIISITADNNYRLYVNGRMVCFGPQLGDITHWRYETVDLAPYLQAGTNTLAVEVMNWGYHRFFGKQSVHTALTIHGYDAAEPVSTRVGESDWKVFRNPGWHPQVVQWRSATPDIIGGLYANNPTDSLVAEHYPWGWKTAGFNDQDWPSAIFLENTDGAGGGFAWLLEPRNVPLQQQQEEPIGAVVRTNGPPAPKELFDGQNLVVAPSKDITLLLDHGVLTMGYPQLGFSGGAGAQMTITYAENLFNPDKSKGDRNVVGDKLVTGYRDIIRPDGGDDRHFQPTWLRAFRFVEVKIRTADAPLTLHTFINQRTTTPIPVVAEFAADQPEYAQIFDMCRRTVELCTQDYFLSDAYYETMQYVGDTKVHAPVWQALSGHEAHTRNALRQFHDSRNEEGMLMSCYPLKAHFMHATYSMIWVDMLYDYLRYSADTTFTRQFLPGVQQTMAYFAGRLQPNGLLGAAKYKYFVDWYVDSPKGKLAPGSDGANSAVVNLHLAHALQSAAKLFATVGDSTQAGAYQRSADQIKQRVHELCYNEERQLMSERPDQSYYDQHSNIMAVLTDAVPAAEQSALIERTVTDTTLSPATYYYRYYLLEALQKTGRADLLPQVQQPWVDLVRLNASTVVERFESPFKKSRSEAHPWGTAPALFYFTLVAGIEQPGFGWDRVRMAPQLGELRFVKGKYPTPKGVISFELRRRGAKELDVRVEVPEAMEIVFAWRGKQRLLSSGAQQFVL
ncbi:MAG: alpha-L-rhamnosidase C-terminal domain-containing protein [Tunicatimonas sp.]